MKNKLAIILSLLAIPFLASTILACGGMSHDGESETTSTSAAAPASTQPVAAQPASPAAQKLLDSYFAIRTSLAADSADDTAARAADFEAALNEFAAANPGSDSSMEEHALPLKGKSGKILKKGIKVAKKIPCVGHMVGMAEEHLLGDEKPAESGVVEKLRKSSQALKSPSLSLKDARISFAAMSDALVEYAQENHALLPLGDIQLFHCDMANHYWLQRSGEPIGNPYFGSKMPDCGEHAEFAAKTAAAKNTSDHSHH